MKDLLALSRVTTTEAKPFEPAVDLKELADEVISELGRNVERTGGRVEVGRLPVTKADRSQIHQLLQNLIVALSSSIKREKHLSSKFTADRWMSEGITPPEKTVQAARPKLL